MKFGITLILTCLFLNSKSQNVDIQNHSFNFGKVDYWNNDTAWFSITNAGTKDLIFLKTSYNQDYHIYYEKSKIKQGESSKIGIIIYIKETGTFSKDVFLNVNVMDNPIKFTIKGKIKNFHPEALTECPRVNDKSEELKKIFVIEVRDFKSEENIKPQFISLKSRLININLENKDSIYETIISPGKFRLEISKDGYDKFLAIISIEAYEAKFIAYLRKSEIETFTEKSDTLETVVTNKTFTNLITDSTSHLHRTIISIDTLKDTINASSTFITKNEHPQEFDSLNFKFNNLIFIIDISSSMKNENKLTDLKSTVANLVQLLRDDDIVTLIAYSGNADLVLNPTPGNYKDSIIKCLKDLKPGGSSNGSAALQLAYELGEKNYIKGGNNQVYIATDGIFSTPGMSKKATIAYIKEKQTQTKINLSCLAFGNNDNSILFLKDLSVAGKGSFVNISQSYNAEHALENLIKVQSKK